MAEIIDTAGRAPLPVAPVSNPRREAIRVIRQVLRKQDASDDELDDAYEALVELAKD